MPDGPFSMQSLVTISGCSLAVYMLTQTTKGLIDRKLRRLHIPTDILATSYAFIILLLGQIGMGANPLDWKLYFLSAMNSMIVSATAAQIQNKAVKATGEIQPTKL